MFEFARLTVAEFDEFCQKAPGNNFFQSVPMYNRYKNNPGFESYMLGVKKGEEVVLAALVVRMSSRRLPFFGEQKMYSALRGPLMDYDRKDAKEILAEFFRGASGFLKVRGGAAFRISPNVVLHPRDNDGNIAPEDEYQKDHGFLVDWFEEMGLKNLGEYGLGKWLYAIDVEGKKPEEIFKNFRKGLRYNIKWAQDRYGVRVREIVPQKVKYDEEVFEQIMKETEERQDFSEQRSKEWRDQMMEAFGRKMKCYVAEMKIPEEDATSLRAGELEPMAVAMFGMYGDEATYLLAGSRRLYQRYGGPSLIIWHVIQYACSHKIKMVNLYGARPVRGNKLFEFKRGFKGHVLELAGTFVLPLNFYGKIYARRKKYTKYNSDLA